MHYVPPPADLRDAHADRIRTFAFAGFVGFLLLLNFTGVFRTVFGIDTAAILTSGRVIASSINAIGSLLFAQIISADLAICHRRDRGHSSVGEYLAAAEAMFIMLIGEGLESYAASAPRQRFSASSRPMPRPCPPARGTVRKWRSMSTTLQPGDIDRRARGRAHRR